MQAIDRAGQLTRGMCHGPAMSQDDPIGYQGSLSAHTASVLAHLQPATLPASISISLVSKAETKNDPSPAKPQAPESPVKRFNRHPGQDDQAPKRHSPAPTADSVNPALTKVEPEPEIAPKSSRRQRHLASVARAKVIAKLRIVATKRGETLPEKKPKALVSREMQNRAAAVAAGIAARKFLASRQADRVRRPQCLAAQRADAPQGISAMHRDASRRPSPKYLASLASFGQPARRRALASGGAGAPKKAHEKRHEKLLAMTEKILIIVTVIAGILAAILNPKRKDTK